MSPPERKLSPDSCNPKGNFLLVKFLRNPLLARPMIRVLPVLSLPALSLPAAALAAGPAPVLPQGPVTSVDAPAPYRYLDWVSLDEINALPESQRPRHMGVCPGYYLPPVVTPRDPVEDDTKAPVEASAEHYDMVGDHDVRMQGDVVVQQGTRMLESDELQLDTQTKKAALSSNVRIRQNNMLMTGTRADIDMNSKKLSVDNAEYVIAANHIRGTAARIHNTSQDVLVLDKSSYTTCEPNANTWYFEADRLRLNAPQGWGTATNMWIKVKDVPIIYLPWFMFPIDHRRQSGFLYPDISTGSGVGFQLSVPYYLNLAPNYDATVTPVYMTKRGTLLNTEFRFLTEKSKGEIGGGYLEQDALYDDQTRYWGYIHHNTDFKNGWSTTTDYSKVSDPDYFLDIDTELNASALTHLVQMEQTNYRTDHWNFMGLVQQFQTLDKTVKDVDQPYKRLPQLRADGTGKLNGDGLYWTWNSEAVAFENPHPGANRPNQGQRLTASPGLGYRLANEWGFVSPKLRTISTHYEIDGGEFVTESSPSINTYIASMDSGLTFERDTRWFDHAQIQTLEPRAFLLYVPREESQNSIPLFDTALYTFSYDQLFRENRFVGGDRYGDEKKLALGVTSRLISARTGNEWLSMSVGQAFFFDDRYVQLAANTPPQDTKTSALAGRLVWTLDKFWFFYNDVEWDSDRNNIDNLNSGFQINHDNEYLLNVGYLYHDKGALTASPNDEKLKQSEVSFILPVTPRWSVLGRWGYDIELNRAFDNMVGLEYDSCCWKFRLVNRRFLHEDETDFSKVEPKWGIEFQIELKGLASTSKKVDSILDSSISGYQDREEQRKNRF